MHSFRCRCPAGSRRRTTDQAVVTAIGSTAVQRGPAHHREERRRSNAPAATDKYPPLRSVKQPGVRRRPLPDAGNVCGGEVSWRCPNRFEAAIHHNGGQRYRRAVCATHRRNVGILRVRQPTAPTLPFELRGYGRLRWQLCKSEFSRHGKLLTSPWWRPVLPKPAPTAVHRLGRYPGKSGRGSLWAARPSLTRFGLRDVVRSEPSARW